MHALEALWFTTVNWLSAHLIAPALASVHLTKLVDDPQEIAQYFLLTGIQVAIIAFVFRPMETLWPLEAWSERKGTRIDRAYTLIKLFGLLPLVTYLVISPLGHLFGGGGADDDSSGLFSLQAAFPWLGHHPVVLFLIYYAIYDFVYYVVHRLQHKIPWWWALHSLHHSQKQLNCWSNDRDHYLDDLLEVVCVSTVSVLIGVSPTEYALLVLIGELLQNFDHANIRVRFGPVLDKILVDPRYHRLHHMIVDPDRPGLHDCNYSFVFPIWDILFGTALYGEPVRATGVGDPTVNADNDRGIVGQQLGVMKRFWASVRCKAGWRPGDVAFDENHRPVSVDEFDLHALEASQTPLAAVREPH